MDEEDHQGGANQDRSASLDLSRLATVTNAELEAADDEGFLAGNQEYVDLSYLDLADLAACIAREGALLNQISQADDTAGAETAFLAGRKLHEEVEALWHLDVGVASATVALIAAGAHPFLSCNGGFFGALHSRPYPLVRFYLQDLAPDRLLEWLNRAGLSVSNEDGILVLHADRTEPFFAFAQAAWSTLSQDAGRSS